MIYVMLLMPIKSIKNWGGSPLLLSKDWKNSELVFGKSNLVE
jgi:hypothetical protein